MEKFRKACEVKGIMTRCVGHMLQVEKGKVDQCQLSALPSGPGRPAAIPADAEANAGPQIFSADH